MRSFGTRRNAVWMYGPWCFAQRLFDDCRQDPGATVSVGSSFGSHLVATMGQTPEEYASAADAVRLAPPVEQPPTPERTYVVASEMPNIEASRRPAAQPRRSAGASAEDFPPLGSSPVKGKTSTQAKTTSSTARPDPVPVASVAAPGVPTTSGPVVRPKATAAPVVSPAPQGAGSATPAQEAILAQISSQGDPGPSSSQQGPAVTVGSWLHMAEIQCEPRDVRREFVHRHGSIGGEVYAEARSSVEPAVGHRGEALQPMPSERDLNGRPVPRGLLLSGTEALQALHRRRQMLGWDHPQLEQLVRAGQVLMGEMDSATDRLGRLRAEATRLTCDVAYETGLAEGMRRAVGGMLSTFTAREQAAYDRGLAAGRMEPRASAGVPSHETERELRESRQLVSDLQRRLRAAEMARDRVEQGWMNLHPRLKRSPSSKPLSGHSSPCLPGGGVNVHRAMLPTLGR